MGAIYAHRGDRRRHGHRVTVHQISINSRTHIVLWTAAAGADHGNATGHGLKGGDAETLLV